MSISEDKLQKVSIEKLHAYLKEHGWRRDPLPRVNVEMWYRGSGYEGAKILIPAGRDAEILERTLQKLAELQEKSPLDILAEIDGTEKNANTKDKKADRDQ